MKTAIIVMSLATLVLMLVTVMAFRAADRPGDDFGSGLFAWLCAALTLIALIVDAILAFTYALSS